MWLWVNALKICAFPLKRQHKLSAAMVCLQTSLEDLSPLETANAYGEA